MLFCSIVYTKWVKLRHYVSGWRLAWIIYNNGTTEYRGIFFHGTYRGAKSVVPPNTRMCTCFRDFWFEFRVGLLTSNLGKTGKGWAYGVPAWYHSKERWWVLIGRPQFPLSLRVSDILPLLFSRTPLFPYPTSSLQPKISPCSSGNRWIAFWLQRAKVFG